MRPFLVLAAALYAAPALAGDPAFEVGAQAGAVLVDELDTIHTSWYVAPKLGVWFTHGAGLEVDVGLSTGNTDATGHKFLLVAPQLQFVGNPIPEEKHSPVQPIITLGVGLWDKMIDGKGVRGEDYAHTRMEAMGSFGTGLIIPIVGPLHFRTDARMLVTAAKEDELYRSPFIDFLWTAGLGVNIKLAKDTDKDKIPDKHGDLCPTDPEDFDQFQDEDGCPDLDNDADGIKDDVDECKNEAEDLDGFEDANGCPDPDNDGDGVLDKVDACPLDKGTAATDGCPDADGDLIADKNDECPTQAGTAEFGGCPDTDGDGLRDGDDECPTVAGPKESFGCPDRDGDRVPDVRDECPDKPAAKNIDPLRSNGCPSRVFVSAGTIELTEMVFFETGKDKIRSTSFGLLNDVAVVLQKYPEITKIRVEGHTDSVGDDAKNLDLSQRRAQSVVTYLVGKGVALERLVAQGFGETKPVADNATKAGQAQNRRVALSILEQTARKVQVDEGQAAPAAPAVEIQSDTPAAQ